MESFEDIDDATRNMLPRSGASASKAREAVLRHTARKAANPPKALRKTKREVLDLAAYARQFTREAIDATVELMRFGQSEDVRYRAAQSIIDRGHGRPAQAVEHKVDVDITHLHLEAVRTAAELMPHGLRLTESVTVDSEVDSGIALDRDHVDRADESGTDAGD